MNSSVIVINMSGLYSGVFWGVGTAEFLDFSQLKGTDCYCDDDSVEKIKLALKKIHKNNLYGIHFIDNGNYHYLSEIFFEFIDEKVDLVIFDNHPDMQQPMFGKILSCGGWVKYLLESDTGKKYVNSVCIIGVNEELLTKEMYESSRVKFITRQKLSENNLPNCSKSHITDYLAQAGVLNGDYPVVISIDEDVLSTSECITNWDQGNMKKDTLFYAIRKISENRVVKYMDICGGPDERQLAAAKNKALEINQKLNMELLKLVLQEIIVGK